MEPTPPPPLASPRILDLQLQKRMSSSSPKISRASVRLSLTPEEMVLSEADALFVECESYLTQGKSSLAVLPFAAINEWRTRRRDDHLVALCDALQPRIQASEKALRDILESTAQKKEMLRKVAKELQQQLCSCIEYNRAEICKSEPVVEQLRSVVDSVASESSCVKYMLQFNDEVARQKLSEEALRERQAISPWATGLSAVHSLKVDSSVLEDEDHKLLSGKLSSLRTMREETTSELALILEYKETCTQNMTGCSRSKEAVEQILRREIGEAQVPELEHSQFCKDCTNVFHKGESVMVDFEHMQTTSAESTTRLQKLVEIRERIIEIDGMVPGTSSEDS